MIANRPYWRARELTTGRVSAEFLHYETVVNIVAALRKGHPDKVYVVEKVEEVRAD